jgi:hypothetical protein
LTQLGTYRYRCKYPAGAPNQRVNADGLISFTETPHTVGGKFRAYWEKNGGLAQQGYPISGEFQEMSGLDAGKTYTVQYFERAVFEYHPENAGSPHEVLLAQLGTYRRDDRLCTTPGNAPPTAVAPPPPTAVAPPPPTATSRWPGLRFFTSATPGCGATPQTVFHNPRLVYAQVAMDEAPAGTRVDILWSGGAQNYTHTDTQVSKAHHKPVCFDGFSLEPSRSAIGPGKYKLTLRINGEEVRTLDIEITN